MAKLAQTVLAAVVALAALRMPTAAPPAQVHEWAADALSADARTELAAIADLSGVALLDGKSGLRLRCEGDVARSRLTDWARRHGQPLPRDSSPVLMAAEAVFADNAHRTASSVKADQPKSIPILLGLPQSAEPGRRGVCRFADFGQPAGPADSLAATPTQPRAPPLS